jgi:replicative DNA helicase
MASKFEKKVYKPVVLPVDVAGKIPPQAVDLEEAILGALLIEKEAIEEIYNDLVPEAFYKEANQKIYQAILNLYNKSEGIDIITVPNELRDMGVLDEVGGPYYVSMLSSKVASASHIKFHALVVKDKYFKRELIRQGQELINNAFDDGLDSIELIEKFQNGFETSVEQYYGAAAQKTYRELLTESEREYYERAALAKENRMTGIPMPVTDINKLMNGWQNSELTIIGGRPGSGKSSYMKACIKTAAFADAKSAVFSLEVSGVRLVDSIICGEADVDPQKYRKGLLNSGEEVKIKVAIKNLWDLGIYIDDNPNVTMGYLRNKCRILKKKYGLDIVFIDYLQLVNGEAKRGQNKQEEVSNISRDLKLLAMELDVPVVVLAQLNREVEKNGGMRRPELSHLRNSGSLEQDSDNVILIYRAEYYKFAEYEDGTSSKGKGELILAKQRSGNCDTVYFAYNESLTRIYDYMDVENMSQSGSSYNDTVSNAEASFLDSNTDFDNGDKPF